MASPFVRPASLDDAAALGESHYWCWQEGYADLLPGEALALATIGNRTDMWTRVLTKDPAGTFVVETADDRVAGLINCAPSRDDDASPNTGEVLAFYVRQQWWGTGCGSALMAVGLQWLVEQGFAEATLWLLYPNPSAQRLPLTHAWRPHRATENPSCLGHELA